MIEIRHRYTNEVILRDEQATSIREAVSRLTQADPHQRWVRGEPGGARAYLAGANLFGANLARADLFGADLAGANLSGANLFGANLARADLFGADLAGANLSDANLSGADLTGADLTGADLADANLARANLARADLADANLFGAYLGGAWNVPVGVAKKDPPEPYKHATTEEERRARRQQRMLEFRARHPEIPVVENLDARILAAVEGEQAIGTLDMSTWHANGVCGTTHCRAGWAVVLAGEAGKDLERRTSPQHAGSMIYRASTGRVPHFFGTNDDAMADIRRCAAEQVSTTPAEEP